MASDREILELMVKNVKKSNDDTISFLKETIGEVKSNIEEIKKVQSASCLEIQELKIEGAKKTGTFSAISQIISYLWLGLITYFSVNR